jgi:integrase
MSPAAGLDRDDRPSTTRKRQPRYLNAAQLVTFLDKLNDDYRPFGAMLAFAGLRVSEALAVRWRASTSTRAASPSPRNSTGRAAPCR